MGKISFGGGVPEDLAKKAAEKLNGAPKSGGIVKKKEGSSILRGIENAREYENIRAEKEHDKLMRQSKEIKKRKREERYDGLSFDERKKQFWEEQQGPERLKAMRLTPYVDPDDLKPRVNPDSTLPSLEEKRRDEYESWLRKRKEALEEIEYGKLLASDYADWAHGGYYAPEYISEGEEKEKHANWRLADLFLRLANGDVSNGPFPGWEDYVMGGFSNLKDKLFNPEGEEASPESGGTGVQESESLDSVKDNSEKEGGKKRKMKTVRKHSLGGDSKDGKKE